MRKPFLKFDRAALSIKPLKERENDLKSSIIKELVTPAESRLSTEFDAVAKRVYSARLEKDAIIMMIGGHVIRSGVQNYIIDLMKKGYISCLAMNGAGIIHDFEFALIGATTESVARYISEGQFGLWKETGMLNDILNRAYMENPAMGMGEAIGKSIDSGDFPFKKISLLAAGYRLNIPITVHVGIGYDIIHEHPNCDGAVTGATSYNDFLIFAKIVEQLEGGVVMNFGSAVMAPEVFLKALSMARNIAHQKGCSLRNFTTLVCDLHDLPGGFDRELPKDSVGYYYRPLKTMLIRTVADGGTSFYIKGAHADTIPALWSALNKYETK
jgi:hypothetical protein